MLVLTRKVEEEIVIGDGIRVKVLAIHGKIVRLGFVAPPSVRVMRLELKVRQLASAGAGTEATENSGAKHAF
jgi:carbon storage regulator CsrA